MRLHTGDSSIYGAVREQFDELEKRDIVYDVCPGVSAFCGAAAALRVAHFIDLPPEAVAGSVGVHIVQDCYCTVENFCSIPVLTSDTIRLVCRGFEVTVEGKGLMAQELSNGIVVLRGRINSVSYKRGV